MNNWVESLNATSNQWASRFWMATWQAIIVIAIAWLLTTLLYRFSPRVRSWIWRLAYVKILLSLFWTTPIELALLPAAAAPQNEPASRERQRPEEPAGTEQESASRNQESGVSDFGRADVAAPKLDDLAANSTTPPEEPSSKLPDDIDHTPPTIETESHIPTTAASPSAAVLNWRTYLLLTWLIGLLAVIAWLAVDAWRAAKLLRESKPLTDDHLKSLSEDVCRRLGLRRAIRLRSSASARSPVLIRFFRPAIILPQTILDSSSPSPLTGEGRGEGESDLALAIAHEAAHLRRHDLAWNALAAIVHVALYFHPLVWLAHRRIRLEQEMACDELVLQKLSAAPQDYGRMLVNVVRNIAPGVVIVLK